MSLKRCRALPVVAIVALVASGVITFIWSQQRRLIYFPSAGPVPSASSVLPAGRDVVVETQDGMRLGGWYFPHTSGGSGPAVLVCNGNAGDRSMRAELAVALHGLGLSVLLFDYRGYGGNPGRPSEQGLAADARAAQEWLSGQSDVDPARIAYFGESLGAADRATAAGGTRAEISVHVAGRGRRGALPVAAAAPVAAGPLPVDRAHRLCTRAGAGHRGRQRRHRPRYA